MMRSSLTKDFELIEDGVTLAAATFVLILLHGRGGSAQDMVLLGRELGDPTMACLAPQAAQHTWYPNSFLAPIPQNQPWLEVSLGVVEACVQAAISANISRERIAFAGFSQGACLGCEFLARRPARFGALIALTGGLLGPLGTDLRHPGSLGGTPVLLSTGDPDPHVPWSRVQETGEIFTGMGAHVTTNRYPDRPHTILRQEIKAARELIRLAAESE